LAEMITDHVRVNGLNLQSTWSGVHLEKLIVAQLVKNFPDFYGT